MTQFNRPDEKIFANAAKTEDIEDFPDIEQGWALAFEKYKGVPPMEWFNALGKRSDQAIRYLLQKGIADWSASEHYPHNAYVQHHNQLWVARQANHKQEPATFSQYWARTGLTREETIALIPEPLAIKINGQSSHFAVDQQNQKITAQVVNLHAHDVGAFDRKQNLADANPSIVRKNLQLGSAAEWDAGVADGQLMPVGAFGLGSDNLNYCDKSTINELTQTGFYFVNGHMAGLPQAADSYVQVQAGASGYLYQELTLAYNGEKYSRFKRGQHWSGWQMMISTINHHQVTLPVGTPIPWPSSQPPSGWFKCNGARFDKALYPLLAQAYPAGVLPDLRGEFIRGWDDGRGVDAYRTILSWQAHLIAAHKHIGGWGEAYGPPFGSTNSKHYFGSNKTDRDNFLFWTNDGLPFDGDPNPNGVIGQETRPRNIAFLYIVRAA